MDSPLGMPRGSVRAVVTLMLILAGVMLAAFKLVPEWLPPLITLAVRDYFAERAK